MFVFQWSVVLGLFRWSRWSCKWNSWNHTAVVHCWRAITSTIGILMSTFPALVLLTKKLGLTSTSTSTCMSRKSASISTQWNSSPIRTFPGPSRNQAGFRTVTSSPFFVKCRRSDYTVGIFGWQLQKNNALYQTRTSTLCAVLSQGLSYLGPNDHDYWSHWENPP